MIALLSLMILGFMIPALIILGISKNIHKLQSKNQLIGAFVLYVLSCLYGSIAVSFIHKSPK